MCECCARAYRVKKSKMKVFSLDNKNGFTESCTSRLASLYLNYTSFLKILLAVLGLFT